MIINHQQPNIPSKTIELVIGERVKVDPGHRLVPLSEDTEVKIEHIVEDDIKMVTLIKGRAIIEPSI